LSGWKLTDKESWSNKESLANGASWKAPKKHLFAGVEGAGELTQFYPPAGTWKGEGGSVQVKADTPAEFQSQKKRFWKWIDGDSRGLRRNVTWNNQKYPNELPIERLLDVIQAAAGTFDDSFKEFTVKYNELKAKKTALLVKDSDSYATRDLLEVLTPKTVKGSSGDFPAADDDFIFTQNLATVVVVVPSHEKDAFEKWYEMGCDVEKVVPKSARLLLNGAVDKDNMVMYRVVVYGANARESGSAADAFRKACRDQKYVVRDYEYSERIFRERIAEKFGVSRDYTTMHLRLVEVGANTYSDVFEIWLHLKMLRCAVETLLRYGSLSGAEPLLLSPDLNKMVQAKKDLAILATKADLQNVGEVAEEASDEFSPYVCLTLAPLSTSK